MELIKKIAIKQALKNNENRKYNINKLYFGSLSKLLDKDPYNTKDHLLTEIQNFAIFYEVYNNNGHPILLHIASNTLIRLPQDSARSDTTVGSLLSLAEKLINIDLGDMKIKHKLTKQEILKLEEINKTEVSLNPFSP